MTAITAPVSRWWRSGQLVRGSTAGQPRLGTPTWARAVPREGGTRPASVASGCTRPIRASCMRACPAAPEGAAAPGRQGSGLGDQDGQGQHAEPGVQPSSPPRHLPQERCAFQTALPLPACEGPRAGPGLQGAPPPHLRPGPRLPGRGQGRKRLLPAARAAPAPEALSLRLQRPAPLARRARPAAVAAGQPRSPRRRRAEPTPSTPTQTKSHEGSGDISAVLDPG